MIMSDPWFICPQPRPQAGLRLFCFPYAGGGSDAELMQFFLPILRADFAICETYSYIGKTPLTCPISAFGGLQDSRVSYGELAAWREHTRSAFIHRMLPGDHSFLQSAQEQLLQALSQDLAQDMNTPDR